MVLGFLTVGPGEMAVIALIALVLFGPEKLPEIGKQIGMAYRELNRLRGDVQRALDIDEYTRFDLPDISAPLGPTYTYDPPALEGDRYDTMPPSFEASGSDFLPESRLLPAPPGPPGLQETAEHMTSENGMASVALATETSATNGHEPDYGSA